ncbi:MAG: MauE/DoxX family redox-associated membrane protein [Anaerolineales bacterium]
MFTAYALAFFRCLVGLVFLWSCVVELRRPSVFLQTIRQFNLLPPRSHLVAAVLFLAGEGIVVATMLIGGWLATWGFLLAVSILLIFCAALMSVLLRHIQTPCHCFGASKKQVSSYDIVRNIVLIVSALAGYRIAATHQGGFSAFGVIDWVLTGAIATVFSVVLVQSNEIVWVMLPTHALDRIGGK